MAKEIINRKGQVAVWVIIAIFLVASISLFFFIERRVSVPTEVVAGEMNPKQFIDKCVRKYANEAVDIMLPQGGFINPGHSKLYKNTNVGYLCYNSGNYNPCINEHSVLINEIKEEIKNYINPRVEQCFNDYKREIERRNSIVKFSEMSLDVEIVPGRIFVNIERNATISINEQSYSYNTFNIEIINPIYNLARVAMEIASQEAKYCYFEYVGYMILYPEFKISRDVMSDSTEIYAIKDKKSEKELNIAIRSCAIPPVF